MIAHVEEILDWFWKDNVKARVMQPDGTYARLVNRKAPFDVQTEFIADAQKRRKLKQSLE
jgi:polyphosphate kinase